MVSKICLLAICSSLVVQMLFKSIFLSGEPNIEPPRNPPLILPTFVSLACGQDVILASFAQVTTLSITCTVHNGTDPLTREIYKDGVLVNNNFPLTITSPRDNSSFGTYTFLLSSRNCSSDSAVSRVLRQG